MKLTGAEIVINVLLEYGVDTVFGYPGAMILDVYDALYKNGRIKHILSAHEQGAAHAADGYARACGKTGVVFATSGPGASNLVTGIAAAYMDSSPVLAITANVSSDTLGRDGFQELDVTGVTMPVTKYNVIAVSADTLADDLRRCFALTRTGRKGPVLIDIPINVLKQTAEYVPTAMPSFKPECRAAQEDIQAAAQLIKKAQKPLVLAGGGVISSGASEALGNLARKMNIPVAVTMMGLGAFKKDDPLFAGMVGGFGDKKAAQAVKMCDLLIAVGTRFTDKSAVSRRTMRDGAKIIHIDIDAAETDKNVRADLCIVADAENTVEKLSEELLSGCDKKADWLLKEGEAENRDALNDDLPKKVMECINEVYGGKAIVVTDVGQHQIWAAQYGKYNEPRSFITSGGLGAMGFGLGAAVGAYTACPEKPVVLVTGDGSFHMDAAELVTLKKYDLPIKIIVMNNRVLGMVRQWQFFNFGGRFSQTEPERTTSFKKLAEAYGIRGVKIKNNARALKKLGRQLRKKGAAVIDMDIPANALAGTVFD